MAANMDAEKRYAKADTRAKRIKTVAPKKGYSVSAAPTTGRTGKSGSAKSTVASSPAKSKVSSAAKPSVGRSGKRGVSKVAAERSTFGSKMEGAVSQRIRGAEWAYRKAGHAANLRKKAAKNPGGRIAKALAARAAKEKSPVVAAPKRTVTGRSGRPASAGKIGRSGKR